MKFLIKFFLFLILVSCSSREIKVSKYAKFNDWLNKSNINVAINPEIKPCRINIFK